MRSLMRMGLLMVLVVMAITFLTSDVYAQPIPQPQPQPQPPQLQPPSTAHAAQPSPPTPFPSSQASPPMIAPSPHTGAHADAPASQARADASAPTWKQRLVWLALAFAPFNLWLFGLLSPAAWVVLDGWFHDTLRHWPHEDGLTPPVSAVWLRVGARRAADAAVQSLELAARASVAQYLLGAGGAPPAAGAQRGGAWSRLWLVPPAHAAPQFVWPQALAAVRGMVADGRTPPGTTCVVIPGAPPPGADADMAALGSVAWLVVGNEAAVAVVPAPKGAPSVTAVPAAHHGGE